MTTIQKQILPVVEKSMGLKIVDEKSLKDGLDYLGQAKTALKNLTADKKKMTDPLNESLKEIRLRYAPSEAKLEAIIGLLTNKTSEYQTKMMEQRVQAEKKIVSKVESGYIKLDTAITKVEELPTVEKKIGDTTFITTKKFEVVDMEKLPIEYHVADEVAIRRQMLAGNQLEGVKYWTEQRPRSN